MSERERMEGGEGGREREGDSNYYCIFIVQKHLLLKDYVVTENSSCS